MKCKFCSYKSTSKPQMINHIKQSHRSRVTTSSTTNDTWLDDAINTSFSDFTTSDNTSSSFTSEGGSFDGGGSSSDY